VLGRQILVLEFPGDLFRAAQDRLQRARAAHVVVALDAGQGVQPLGHRGGHRRRVGPEALQRGVHDALALARQRDFRGVSPDSFDGRGNYAIGLTEQLVWPEIDYDKIDRIRGMGITIVTTAQTDEGAQRLLALLGMPFSRNR